jgi:hypothetical protein
VSSKSPTNRGRVQAQGPDTEESVAWPPPESAPTKEEMLSMLSKLKGKLTARELDDRSECFEKAQKFVEEAPVTGYDAHCIKSWANRKMRGGVRVDIEIQLGKACVG